VGAARTHSNLGSVGLRAVGVQSFDDATFGQFLVFAVNNIRCDVEPRHHRL